MADLSRVFSELGYCDAKTLLQSGNVAFIGHASSCRDLEIQLQAECQARLGLDVAFFVRTAEEWTEVIEFNPFTPMALADPSHLVVHFLNEMPLAYDVDRVQGAIMGPEEIRAGSKHLYVTYPNGIGTSTIGRTPGWNKLTANGTARNWNTILKLHAMLHGD